MCELVLIGMQIIFSIGSWDYDLQTHVYISFLFIAPRGVVVTTWNVYIVFSFMYPLPSYMY